MLSNINSALPDNDQKALPVALQHHAKAFLGYLDVSSLIMLSSSHVCNSEIRDIFTTVETRINRKRLERLVDQNNDKEEILEQYANISQAINMFVVCEYWHFLLW